VNHNVSGIATVADLFRFATWWLRCCGLLNYPPWWSPRGAANVKPPPKTAIVGYTMCVPCMSRSTPIRKLY